MILGIFIDDKPEFVKIGERERDILCRTYADRKAYDQQLIKY